MFDHIIKALSYCRHLSKIIFVYLFSHKETEYNQTTPSFGSELCVKLSTDQWVIGKQVDQREVYIVVAMKNSNLIEIMEEVDKLISTEFRNICLLEK